MRVLFALTLAVALSGCNMLYKQPVQQGNLLEDDQVDALKPGMTKRQVSLVLGSPALSSPFREDRWDYVSSYKDGDGKVDLKRLTVIFENDVLVRIEGQGLSAQQRSARACAPAPGTESRLSEQPLQSRGFGTARTADIQTATNALKAGGIARFVARQGHPQREAPRVFARFGGIQQ